MSRLQQLQQMLQDEPNDSFLNYALALEYAKENDLSQAISIIEKIVERDENYLGAYYQLGKLYEQQNLSEKAISTYHKGITIAKAQNNKKAQGELNEALWMLED
ncbi:MAG: tetratricopeptide repeat protein [Bacteroidetes bacterium]|nr:tetratricopeptide repeat protein [Bacteroidota bacterium]